MFVKLVFHDGRASLYQCDRFFIAPVPGSYTFSEVTLESNHPNGSVSLGQLDRTQVNIFVMNDQGRTIESYWAPAPPA
jgi:hypothetical protein